MCVLHYKGVTVRQHHVWCTLAKLRTNSSYNTDLIGKEVINLSTYIHKHFERNVYATWRGMCEKNEDVIRVCMQVKELVDMRDKYVDGVLNRGEML